MPYRIDYRAPKKVRGLEKRTVPQLALGAACLLLLSLLALGVGPRPSVTAAALEDLAGNLRAGESISDALNGFCRQVSGLD